MFWQCWRFYSQVHKTVVWRYWTMADHSECLIIQLSQLVRSDLEGNFKESDTSAHSLPNYTHAFIHSKMHGTYTHIHSHIHMCHTHTLKCATQTHRLAYLIFLHTFPHSHSRINPHIHIYTLTSHLCPPTQLLARKGRSKIDIKVSNFVTTFGN